MNLFDRTQYLHRAAELVSQLCDDDIEHEKNLTRWIFIELPGGFGLLMDATRPLRQMCITHHVYITVAVPSSTFCCCPYVLMIYSDGSLLTPVSRSNILLCVVHRGVLQGRPGGVIVRDSFRLRPLGGGGFVFHIVLFAPYFRMTNQGKILMIPHTTDWWRNWNWWKIWR